MRLSFDLELDFGKRKAGEQRVGLRENLEAWAEKRRMEAAAPENNKIIAAKFPKLWQSLRKKVEDSYREQTDVRYAAARLWVDKILDPAETRSARRRKSAGQGLSHAY